MPLQVYLSAPAGYAVPRDALERAARATLESEGVREAELSLTLLRDSDMRSLNERWLGHRRPTDVLSFALHDSGARPVGDIYVGVEQAARQAKDDGVPVEEELIRLVIHGTLHVLGYDHPEEPEARAGSTLYRKQEALVRRLLEGGPEQPSASAGARDDET